MIKLCAFSDEAASPLKGQIAALKRNNIRYMELRSIDGKNVSTFTVKEAKKYKTAMLNEGIKVWSIGSPIGKVDINVDFKEYLQLVEHVCELANVFGCDRIRAFSFFNAYNEKNKVFDYMNQMGEVAGRHGVSFCHENEKDIYGDTLERVLEIMKNVKSWNYVYDPANFLQVGEKAEDTLNALHAKMDYFHIKDVISSTGELVPSGYGDGKIDKLVSMIDVDRVLTLEPHLRVFDAYKAIDNTEMKTKFRFTSNDQAFDAAVKGLKDIILSLGYKETSGGFIK